MYVTIYAKLNQGIDTFLRVTTTLRRKEIKIHSIKMITDENNENTIELVLNENNSSIEVVLNYMNKIYDIKNIEVNNNIFTRYT